MPIMKNSYLRVLMLLFVVLIYVGCNKKTVDMRYSMGRNVCKNLSGSTLVYIIFVDSKTTKPWTSFDIRTTLDSAKLATQWISKQAKANGKTATFKVEYFHSGTTYTVNKDLPKKSLYESVKAITDKQGWKKINTWADNNSKKALSAFPETKNYYKLLTMPNADPKKAAKPNDTEKLVVALKEKYKTDNIAVCYMLNNYYKNDLLLSMNTFSLTNPEYIINSYKSSHFIAQQILSLFGGLYFFRSPKDFSKPPVNEAVIEKDFPNEVMLLHNDKHLSTLEISPVTKYLLGWTDYVDKKYNKVFKRDLSKEN